MHCVYYYYSWGMTDASNTHNVAPLSLLLLLLLLLLYYYYYYYYYYYFTLLLQVLFSFHKKFSSSSSSSSSIVEMYTIRKNSVSAVCYVCVWSFHNIQKNKTVDIILFSIFNISSFIILYNLD